MSEPATNAHRLVAGVLRRGGRVLLVHRSAQRAWYADSWDLPGGHVRDSEAPTRGLERELNEELGVAAVIEGEPFAYLQGDDFRAEIWLIDRWQGEPCNRDPGEHDALAWLNEQEMAGLDLADPRIAPLVGAALNA
jgi:8-oxo-dGTP pyrophosphatase MutT (NUDIX family)